MIGTADDVERGSVLEVDLCICGAGAAGITVARELAGKGLRIALLESGDLLPDEATSELSRGTSSGTPYDLYATRLRYLGGTTGHWGGFCRPLDPSDFEPRDWIANSGWPIDRATLDPYYARSAALLGIEGSFDIDARRRDPGAVVPMPIHDADFTTTLFIQAAVRFGDTFRADLERGDDLQVLLGANVIDLIRADPGSATGPLDRVSVATLAGNRFEVRARAFVLALGGIENARVLLAADNGRGVGNDHDLVGRYFMDHIENTVATVVLTGPADPALTGGRFDLARAAFAPTRALLERERLANIAWILQPYPFTPDPAADLDGLDPDDVAAALRAVRGGGSIPYSVQVRAEPEPDRTSRVTLGRDRDALGMPRADVHWTVTEADRERIIRATDLFVRHVGLVGFGFGRLDVEALAPQPIVWAAHHMGTTRMATDARNGVVDTDLAVHGVANLYAAGSSVFPAVGYANPTFTILALAFRLADHLLRRLRP